MLIVEELEKQQRYSELETVINDRVKDRIDDSQKEYYLREKLKAIKEELGDLLKDWQVEKLELDMRGYTCDYL